MSEIKVNKITPRVACGTTQLGDSGDTFTVASGATIQNLGTATGFGGTGVVSWDTASIKTTGFTAVTGTGYFCNTTGGIFTVTLPLSPAAGAVVGVADYAQTFDTNNLTLGRNSSNIGGVALDSVISTEGIAVTLVYVDGTKGWIVTDSGNQSDAPLPTYVAATGGCITTCGNFKMHTFLSPNTFTVCCAGNGAGSNTVDYLVVAGGGGGGGNLSGGGGGGGFRFTATTYCAPVATDPRAGPAAITVNATGYPIQVGGGGGGVIGCVDTKGTKGSDSIFDSITSTGGGGGGSGNSPRPSNLGDPGGSGGGPTGYVISTCTGAGNTPVVSPSQGFPGGIMSPTGGGPGYAAAGGGGAGVAGTNGASSGAAGPGGDGLQINTCGTDYYYSGGGGGGSYNASPKGGDGGNGGGGGGNACTPASASPGGPGRNTGGAGGPTPGVGAVAGGAGGLNTGGGGGGSAHCGGAAPGGAGGSGIVIIRYRYQ